MDEREPLCCPCSSRGSRYPSCLTSGLGNYRPSSGKSWVGSLARAHSAFEGVNISTFQQASASLSRYVATNVTTHIYRYYRKMVLRLSKYTFPAMLIPTSGRGRKVWCMTVAMNLGWSDWNKNPNADENQSNMSENASLL